MSEVFSFGIGSNRLNPYPLDIVAKNLSQFSTRNISAISIHNPTPAHIAIYEDKGNVYPVSRAKIVLDASQAVQVSSAIVTCPPFSFVCMPVSNSATRYLVVDTDYVADIPQNANEAVITMYGAGDTYNFCAIQYSMASKISILTNLGVAGSGGAQVSVTGSTNNRHLALPGAAKNTLYVKASVALASARLFLNAFGVVNNAAIGIGVISPFPNGFIFDLPNGVLAYDLTPYAGTDSLIFEYVFGAAGGTISAWVESEFNSRRIG